MRHRSFGEFLDKKKREGVKQLGLLQQLLERSGMKVEDFIENDEGEPYIFCANPSGNGSFGGIRIYKIGNQLAFRVQKENKTHPYGSAYPLNVEQMFNDFLTDEGVDEEKAGKKVIEHLSKEIKKFFEKSGDADKHGSEFDDRDQESSGNVLVRTTGTDYSALIYNKV